MTRLRILHSVPSLNSIDGGPARSVPALAAAEAANGAEVVVWSQQPATIDLTLFPDVQFVSGRLNHVVTSAWTPDIIHDQGLWLPSNHASARIGRRCRIPRIVSPRGMLEPWCLQHRRIRKLAAWKVYQHRDLLSCACLHATSESEARQFRQLGFTQPVVQLPNGVTLPPDTLRFPDGRQKTGPSGEREVLFLSRIHPVKGLLHLIEAWRQVVCPGWKLRIVGSDEGGHQGEIRKLVIRHQLQDSITIDDAVHSEEKWRLLRDASVVVLPSFSENFGIVVAEALGMGTPVITTTGTPWRQIQERRCGWYVEPTTQGIATGLRSALNTPSEVLQAMGDRGRRWVRDSFEWHDIGRRMLQSYEWLLDGGSVAGWIEPPSRTRARAA